MKPSNARFQCQKCEHQWEQMPGPTVCPLCQHLYITWLNYEELFVKFPANK